MLWQINIVGRYPICRAVFFFGPVQILKSVTVVQIVVDETQQPFNQTGFFIIESGEWSNAETSVVDAFYAEGLESFVDDGFHDTAWSRFRAG